MTQGAGQAVPEPVLEVVHECEEHRCKKRRRYPDHGAEADEPEVGGAAETRGRVPRGQVLREERLRDHIDRYEEDEDGVGARD